MCDGVLLLGFMPFTFDFALNVELCVQPVRHFGLL